MVESPWDEYAEDRAERGRNRREWSKEVFPKARDLATEHGLLLKQYSEMHYQLIQKNGRKVIWIHNIYPGNQRISADRKHMGPFLHVPPTDWTVLDVVKAAIYKEKKDVNHRRTERSPEEVSGQ